MSERYEFRTKCIAFDNADSSHAETRQKDINGNFRNYDVGVAGPSQQCGCLVDQGIRTMPIVTAHDQAIDLSYKTQASTSLLGKEGDLLEKTDDKFKNTFLYKIMVDPTFVDKIRSNKQIRKFTCPFCKQNFSLETDLSQHMDVRRDESNLVSCCACGKNFSQKRYLRYHQRCHSERNKFTCEICTKEYSRLDNLTRHNNFHTNPNKFSCNACERTFARKDLLNKHQKIHENKLRYYCQICQKYFKGPISLMNHNKLLHSTM
ncbi:gastrula zinc finger protein XlCGF7.1 [Orussus abietinus]|uniref:gastrula zinc finger protein XlCGF7.1 n=1 Tax=Orussus abietinus TaxID=222816 RepID=UPI0006250A18|nr:gastrula zinc finger protein XlCGF7.1 [Orussus abietinus]